MVAYHSQRSPMPRLYARALAARGDAKRLEAVIREMDEHAASGKPLSPPHSRSIAQALLHLTRGEPTLAVERLKSEPFSAHGTSNFGASFMSAWLLARALRQAGRVGEAKVAYAETIRRRSVHDQYPEVAFHWQDCLGEALRVFRELGDEAEAAKLEARLQRVRP